MKKVMIPILLMSMIGLAACSNDSAVGAANTGSVAESTTEELKVEINVSTEDAESNGMPLILTPKLSGENDKELQYHWTVEPEEAMEVLWVSGAMTEVMVQLEVTETDSADVIATDEITIVGNGGIFSLK